METPKFESGPRIPSFDKEIWDEYMTKGDESRAAAQDLLEAQKNVREVFDAQSWKLTGSLHNELRDISIKILQLEESGTTESPELDQLRKTHEEKLGEFREFIKDLTVVSDAAVAKREALKEKHAAFMEVADGMLGRSKSKSD